MQQTYKTSLHLSAIAAATAALCATAGTAAAQAQPSQAADAGLQQVIVTAQKVKENAQKVPLSITSLSAEALADAGVKNLVNMQSLVTGVNVIDQGPGASVQIRGIGSNPGGGNVDPSAAFSVDGVYQSRAGGAFGAMYDLERVEVLKGPQGTLYGRNATVGAVNVIGARPGARREGSLEVELGNYQLRRVSAMANLPLNEVVKLRVAAQAVKRDGFLSDGYNDADDKAGRLKVAIDPSRDLSVLLTLDGHVKTGNGQGNIYTGLVSTTAGAPGPGFTLQSFTQTHVPVAETSDPWQLAPMTFTAADMSATSTTPSNASGHAAPPNRGLSIRNNGLTAEINKDFGGATLTVIPAVRNSFVLNQSSTGGALLVPVYSRIDQRQRSLELRLASSQGGALRWIGGYFFMDEDAPTLSAARSQNGATTGFTDMTTVNAKSQALFGQASYAMTPALRATLGLRYTRDDKEQSGRIFTANGSLTDPAAATSVVAGSAYRADGEYSSDATNYRLGLDYSPDKDSMLYASLSSGYKAGGLNFMGNGGGRQAYAPEKLRALALGGKFRGLQNRFQLNGELFLWKYRDQQVAVVDSLDSASARGNGGVNLLLINNGGTSTMYGADLDAIFRITPDDRVNASLAYLHARNGDFVIPQTKACNFAVASCALEATTDVSGKVMPFSPTWQLNLGYTRSWSMPGGGELNAGIDAHAETSSYVNYHLFAPEYQAGYVKGNLNLSYSPADDMSKVSVYVRNVGDVAVLSRGSVLGSAGASIGHYAGIMDPRTFGVSYSRKF